jgi:hypothetical protein
MPGTGSAADAASAKLLRRVLWAILLFVGSILLFVALLYGQRKSHEYQAATSTMATITSCWSGRSGVTCSGTWNVGGQRYHGTIEGVDSVLPAGSPVGVRANSYRAFTMASTSSFYHPAIGVSVFLVIAALALSAWGLARSS